MAKKLSTDLLLLAVTVALLGFGLVMVYSASVAFAEGSRMTGYQGHYFLLRQTMFVGNHMPTSVYGGLLLTLVCNPGGPSLPAPQAKLATPWYSALPPEPCWATTSR